MAEDSEEDGQEGVGYHPEGRRIETPTDVERDLNFSFPKRDYVLPRIIPIKYFKWKEELDRITSDVECRKSRISGMVVN